MKYLILLSLTCLLNLKCKDMENIITPPCVCNKLLSGNSFPDIQDGFIYFPKGIPLYRVEILKEIKPYGKNFLICTDSTFIQLVQLKGLKDSALIRFTADFLIDAPCGIVKEPNPVAEPFPVIRITKIE